MTKTIAQHALTHVKAYVFEIIEEQEYALKWMNPEYQEAYEGDKNDMLDVAFYVEKCIIDAKTFVEVKKILTKMYGDGQNASERCYTKRIFPRIEAFYNAMKKVVPTMKYKSHSGTEDRGYWRVFDEITNVQSYFCSGDLGRDMLMAKLFRDVNAITEQQYQNHVTKRTLAMMRVSYFQTDGQPDANLIVGYLKPEYRTDEFFDFRFINAIAA